MDRGMLVGTDGRSRDGAKRSGSGVRVYDVALPV